MWGLGRMQIFVKDNVPFGGRDIFDVEGSDWMVIFIM